MSYINETDFVIENKELVYPEIVTDGLQLYYDAKGKRDTDYHRDTMLDMSGNKNHGKLHNFAYEKHSGYKDGLVFDYIDDKLVRPTLDGIDANNFTYQLNSNILAFIGDEVKTVKNGSVEIGGRNYWAIAKKPWHSHLAYQGDGVFTNNNTDFAFAIFRMDKLEVPVGETYTVSFEINVSDDAIQFGNDRFYINGEVPNGKHNKPTLVKDKWVKVYATFNYTVENTRLVHIYIGGIPSINTFKIRNFKLEKGNKVTDWTPAPEDLIKTTELKGNILGDMENIIDGLYKTEVLSGEEIYTDKADDSVVHVEVDGKSYQRAGSGKNLSPVNTFTGALNSSKALQRVIAYNIPIDDTKEHRLSFRSEQGWARITALTTNEKVDESITEHNGMYTHAMRLGGKETHSNSVIPSGYKYLTITTSPHTLSSGNVGQNVTIYDIQLEEGSTATEYEPPAPSPDYPIEIHSLNDVDVVSSVGKRNLIYEGLLEDGTFTWNTYALGGGGNTATNFNKKFRSYIPIEPNTNYYVSTNIKTTDGKTIEIACSMIDSARTYVDGFGRRTETPDDFNGFVFKTAPNAKFARFRFGNANSGNNLSFDNAKFVLVKIDTPVPYSPALEDISEDTNHPLIDKINLLLDEPLRSVGDVKDRLFRDSDGLWKVERNVGVWNISEDAPTAIDGDYFFTYNHQTNRRAQIVSTHFSYDTTSSNRIGFSGAGYLRIHGRGMSGGDFRTWVRNLNAKAYYPLDSNKVVTETLDQELQDKLNNLRSFQDSNYVYTVLGKTDILPEYIADNLKPTLHAKFLYNNWYKEDRVINNLMIYNRALTNEEMLQNYKTIKRRWGM